MPKGDAHVVLITDKITESTFKGYRNKFLELVDEKIVVDLEPSMTGLQRSRWLKTKSRELVKGDMLYIDSDTIFIKKIDDLDEMTCELGAVKDGHVSRVNSSRGWNMPSSDEFIRNCKKLGYDVTSEDITFNGGMVYAKDSAISHTFFNIWHEEWLKGKEMGINTDQPSFTKANLILGHPMHEVSGIWNCQVSCGLKFLYEAKILHYFTTAVLKKSKSHPQSFWFMNDFVYREVRENMDIPSSVKEALKHPLNEFREDNRILVDEAAQITRTRIFAYTYYIYIHHEKLFLIFEKFLAFISNLKKKK